MKVGESMRSAVSSRRRRRGFDVTVVVVVVAAVGGEADGEGMDADCEDGGVLLLNMPDSRRTVSSWSSGGSR